MSISQSDILNKKHSLHRAPPPKAPTKPSPLSNTNQNMADPGDITRLIPSVKLKKTGFRDSLIAEDVDNKHSGSTNEATNELQSTLARMRAKFEHQEEEEVKPKPKPKPKPRPSQENMKLQQDKENETKQRSGSCSNDTDESKNILTDSNKNGVIVRDSRGEPKLCNLPTLDSLGKAPPKNPKPGYLVNLLEKYDSNSIVMAPRRNTLSRAINMNGVDNSIAEEQDEGEDYDDVDEDLKAQILNRNEAEQEKETAEEEGIMEENYDDVDEMKEKVEEINNALAAQNPEPICDENYDDLDTVAEQARDQLQNDFATEGDETFGEEMYDAVGSKLEEEEEELNGEASSDAPVENKSSPPAIPSTPPSKEKGKRDQKKEQENLKKKEKEEQKRRKDEEKRREKEERDEKKRREEEKRKREREDKELRKKHKLKPGTEGIGVGESKSNFAGEGKFELPVKEGDTLVIISDKQGCPQGKWLVKNTEGHLGYIPMELIQLKIDSEGNRTSAIITEDFYEDVDQYQGQGQVGGQIEEEDDDQEFYDDIAGQAPIDEDLYEELPGDQ